MERLRQSDLKSLLAFIRVCYAIPESAPFHTFVSRLLAALPCLIPAAHVTYNEMYPDRSKSHNWANTAELAGPLAARLWERHMNEHPVLEYVLRSGGRYAMRISDFWSETRLRDSGLHSDFYKRYDISDALCITVPCPLPRVIGIGWHDDRRFTARERLIANLVRPHINQAWHNARLASRLQLKLRMLRRGMDNLPHGVILCSPQGRIQFVNAHARQHLAEYFGTTRQSDRSLPDDLLQWVRTHNSELSENDDAPTVRVPLVREKAGSRLVLRLLSEPGANLILMEEERTLPDTSAIGTLGLTAREVEVLSWIARGKTNNEISAILQMHIGTAKKHVEHILVKLGVETRTAAAARALASNQPESDSQFAS